MFQLSHDKGGPKPPGYSELTSSHDYHGRQSTKHYNQKQDGDDSGQTAAQHIKPVKAA
jgi:hypothetical protein